MIACVTSPRADRDLHPARALAERNLITGVSFLGAGTIFVSKAEERVKGLTTAASILVKAAVGRIGAFAFIFWHPA
jgi:putative Mg2+ transporter-C (MgtC) family protein